MNDSTIMDASPMGKHLKAIASGGMESYLLFNKKKIQLVAQITLGREDDNTVVIDNKLASRHHAMIQKIKDAYFLKDLTSTNGTFLNGIKIPSGKYVKLNRGDKITIGSSCLVFG